MPRDPDALPSAFLDEEDAPLEIEQTPLATGAELADLRARLMHWGPSALGFDGPPRLVLALDVEQLPALSAALILIAEFRPLLTRASPRAPRSLGVISLGDRATVEMMALPNEDAYAPFWHFFLPSVVSVIDGRSPEQSSDLLARTCAARRVPLWPAEALLGEPLDLRAPYSLIRLLRAAFLKLLPSP